MKLGDSPMRKHQHLESVSGASSNTSGASDVFKAPRSGAPKTAMIENAIGLVRHVDAIAYDQHIISILKITEICYLSHVTVHRVIHEELGMIKVCAKWPTHFQRRGHKR